MDSSVFKKALSWAKLVRKRVDRSKPCLIRTRVVSSCVLLKEKLREETRSF